MAILRKSAIIVLLCMITPLSAQNSDEFLSYLKARNDSIKSFEIKLRRASFTIGLKDYDAFKEDFEKIEQSKGSDLSVSEQAEQLVQKWGKPDRWFGRHTIQLGERFKETQIQNGEETDIRYYDGLLNYRYSKRNQQFDIYTKVPNIKHADLSDIGFGFNAQALQNKDKMLSFEKNGDTIKFVFTHMVDILLTISQTYNSDFSLLYSQTKIDEDYQVENYYLLHRNIEGYQVPGISIDINVDKSNNECDIYIYLIEEVKFNPFVTNKDFSVGDIPDNTTVVDYRFNPEKVEKYREFRYAAYNPDNVRAGSQEAEDLIKTLNNSRNERKSLSIRDSRTGKKAPSLDTQQWLNKPINLNTWPPEQLTVINFWEIGCGFCIREIPENNELYKWFEEKGILFLSIHLARNNTDNVMDFIQNSKSENDIDINKIQYPVAIDKPGTNSIGWSSATFNKYGIDGIPDNIIIDKNGNIISYERTIKKEDIDKILSGDKDIIARMQGRQKSVRKLNAIPNGWIQDNLEPNSEIMSRYFIYREDTPDLVIQNVETEESIETQWIQHTSMNQTVQELLLSTKAPDWGKSIKGNITILTEHSQVAEFITIPYELKSKSIAEYVSPVIWFGSVRKGNEVSRRITLQSDSNSTVTLNKVTVPSTLQLEIHDKEQNSNNIFIDCVLSSTEPGFQTGNIELLAVNEQDNKKSLKLKYCAFVQE